MKPNIYIQVAIWFVSAAAMIVGVYMALFALIFFGNFNFGSNAHLCIFALTLFAPIMVAACWLFFVKRPSTLSASLTVSSWGVTAIAFFLWQLPAARGLIH